MYHQQILKLLLANGVLLKQQKMQRVDQNLKKSWVTIRIIEFFYHICSSNNQALADQEFSKVGEYLIIQVKCFLVFNQALTKNISKISCKPPLTVPVTLNKDIVDHKKFNLMTTINHLHNLPRRHYTSFIKSAS